MNHFFSYRAVRYEGMPEQDPTLSGVFWISIKDGMLEVNEKLSDGTACNYSGSLNQSASSYDSTGTLDCISSSESTPYSGFKKYEIKNLSVDKNGILKGHFKWKAEVEDMNRIIIGWCVDTEDVLGVYYPKLCSPSAMGLDAVDVE